MGHLLLERFGTKMFVLTLVSAALSRVREHLGPQGYFTGLVGVRCVRVSFGALYFPTDSKRLIVWCGSWATGTTEVLIYHSMQQFSFASYIGALHFPKDLK